MTGHAEYIYIGNYYVQQKITQYKKSRNK